MVYLQVDSVSKAFGEKSLFENISFSVHKDQKVAMVAKNGTGKSTLLKIIAGLEAPDTGSVVKRNDITFAYLDQNPEFDHSLNVLEGIFASSSKMVSVIRNYEAAIASHDQKLIEAATDEMEHNQAWDYEARVKQILGELSITNFEQKIGELSGGQKKRLALANVLITEPDLLILDEPTNHLDLDMIIWLEKMLSRSKSTILMVTHDRYFLDRVCSDILEMDNGTMYRYKGNYSYFLEKREERIIHESTVIERAQNLFRKELEWMRRMPKARTHKSKSRIESFYDVKEVAYSGKKETKVKMEQNSTRLGKKIIEINYISKKYDDLKLLENFTYYFKQQERVGIVGRNGTGKSTLLNMIAGLMKPDAGTIEVGETVVIGYYRQDGISFNEDQRVIDIVKDICESVKMESGREVSAAELLRRFLFTGEMQYTQVAKLSGGERRRLYLLTILLRNPNFLILDEPTNDLDIHTLNVLEEYLNAFNGCVLVVSHDRYFMDKVVEHLFVFEENLVVRDFPGNYTQYLNYKEIQEEEAKRIEVKPEKQIKEKVIKEKPNKLSWKEQQEYNQLESDIQELEEEKKEIEAELSTGLLGHQEIMERSNRLGVIMSEIDEKSTRWLELSMKVE